MTRLEVHMEALLMNDEEAEALKERVKCYRRKKAEISHQKILQNVAKHALSLTPPRSTSKPKTPSHLIPADPTSSSYMPRKVIYSNPQKSKQKNQQQKQQQQQSMLPKQQQQQQSKSSSPKNSMPVTMIGVMSHPKPLSPISSSPPPSDSPPPLQNYNEWKKRQPKKDLPKVWKQTDTPPSGEDEEETIIELPESLQEREEMVDDAQKKNDDSEQRELIPVDPSRSFEKHYLFPTPPSSTTSSLSSTLPPPSRDSSSQYASNTDLSSYYTTTTDESYGSTKSRSSSQEALSPPFLIVPKTINALAANNIGKVYITDKLSDLDKLVLATAFSPVPVKQKPPKHAGKSKSDFAIHQKRTTRSPFKSLFKKSAKKSMKQSPTSPAAEGTKFPPERNIDVCKQYEIVKAVRFPNKWLDEMEAIAIIIYFLIAVIALLFYRSIIIIDVV